MTLETLALRVLAEPSPDALWRLQPHLLALGTPEAEAARAIAGMFYSYLASVRSKLSSKQYSTLAAKLAAGSVGTFSVQELINALRTDRANALRHLLVGGIAETLEVFSTIQHIKAWEAEFAFMHEDVVWQLYEQWWRLSIETQPDLSPDQRHGLIDSLLAPVRDSRVDGAVRMAMVMRLFQVLLLVRVVPLLSDRHLATLVTE